jgi:hypothetical protein
LLKHTRLAQWGFAVLFHLIRTKKRGGWNGSVLRRVAPRTNHETSCFSPSHIAPTPTHSCFHRRISYDIHYGSVVWATSAHNAIVGALMMINDGLI